MIVSRMYSLEPYKLEVGVSDSYAELDCRSTLGNQPKVWHQLEEIEVEDTSWEESVERVTLWTCS